MSIIEVDIGRFDEHEVLKVAKDCGYSDSEIQWDGDELRFATVFKARATWLAEALVISGIAFEYRLDYR